MNHIRLAQLGDLDDIMNVLNEVTLDLNNKGIYQWTYPWGLQDIKQEIEQKHIYLVLSDQTVIGTFSIKEIKKEQFELMQVGDLYLYRIAISPKLQGKKLGIKIIQFAIQYASEQFKSFYLDCWNGNEKLRHFYQNTGLEYIGDYSEEDYFISVFRKEFK